MKYNILPTLLAPDTEIIKYDIHEGVIITSVIGPPKGRKGYEKKLMPVTLAGLEGWERAHSQGNITGHESAHGIAYAPSLVNQALQKLGVENYITQWFEVKPEDVVLILTTATYMHDEIINGKKIKGNRLKEIIYRVEAMKANERLPKLIFEAWIAVDDNKMNPRVTCDVEFHHEYGAFNTGIR